MPRTRMPVWELFKYPAVKDETTGVWTVRGRYRDDSGARRDIKRSGKTAGAADRALRLAFKNAQVQSQQHAERAQRMQEEALTLGELAMRWLEWRKPAPVKIDQTTQTGTVATDELRLQTWTSYESNLRLHILPAMGELNVSGLKTSDCERTIHDLYNKQAGTGYRTAAMAKQVLMQVMDYAVRQGHRSDNPVRSVSRIPNAKKAPVKLKQATVAAVHEAVRARQPEPGVGGPKPTSRLSDVVLLLMATGLRIGEVLAVRWDDIHINGSAMFLTVSGTLIERKGAFYRQNFPKTDDSQRTLPLTQEWIKAMIRRRNLNRRLTPTNAVFPTRNGTFVRPSNFRDDLKKATGGTLVGEKITPHVFRSTVGTAISEEFGHEAAQMQLGHSSPETTRRHYIQRPDIVPDYSSSLGNLAPPSD
ncbi:MULTISPECIES: site-specific integrase [Paenarthrobacter]|uniref:Site-specific integrase n=3 Tax=Paenarthrobacter TaxID=1742992 RepID=A0AAX3EKQ7_PAEUR|nr:MULTISPECIES: site-specific integrase [Paenarthrobacter]QMU81405.1 site-specific integrase [Paenarthrobacter ureafaciens]UYV93873.1 site-specific integrase [Paenarthrobacter ureafaciens]UYV98399.1 site-specific integrase [Paenarthrobacter ureafaciens]WIV29715.1 site-specific integrase [Paenarthrobacter sp. R1]